MPHLLKQKRKRERPLIAFFDYHDVFEDFYPHYGVTQREFATSWSNSGNHAFIDLLQKHIGDVVWHTFSLAPEVDRTVHKQLGCEIRFARSSLVHRLLWRSYYDSRLSSRLQKHYRHYELLASYTSLISLPFARALCRERPDYLFVQDYATGRFDVLSLLSKVLRIPLIARHAGSAPERYVGKLAKHWSLPRATIIASSRYESQMLAERYGVPEKQLHVILTPIDIYTYTPKDRTAACEYFNLPKSRRYLLFVGRLNDNIKRVSSIIKVFSELQNAYPDVDVLIAGDGPDYDRLRRLATTMTGGRVRMLGWIGSADERAQLYNTADLLVLPSLSEGFPAVVGESLACGTPVLASDVGGVRELVTERQTGWLIRPGDDAQLKVKLATALSDTTAAVLMRVSARAAALEKVSPEKVVESLKACFGTLALANAPH